MRIISVLMFMVFGATLLLANDALEIMKKVEARDKGNNIVSNMKMILIDKNKSKRVRQMRSYSKEIGDVTKSMIFFLSPSDVKNTAFLTYDYTQKDKSDDQWLYLPALKKIKRIPSSDKSSSFMGSDFTYSDMTDPVIDDYNYKILKQTTFKGHDVWIIESKPKKQKTIDETGYKKSIVYIRKDIFMPIAGKHYLARNGKIKYFRVHKFENIDGVWFGTQISMTTKQSRRIIHKTLLEQTDIKIDPSLKESYFSTRTIQKGI